jgi:hypothetical protein
MGNSLKYSLRKRPSVDSDQPDPFIKQSATKLGFVTWIPQPEANGDGELHVPPRTVCAPQKERIQSAAHGQITISLRNNHGNVVLARQVTPACQPPATDSP